MARVLIVDDDLTILRVTKAILARSGLATLTADNGAQALTLLQTHDIDVLLTDLAMPDMSGQELIEEARRRCPDLRVCCMTAFAPLGGIALERVLVVPKPFVPKELVNAVWKVLEARRRSQIGSTASRAAVFFEE